MANNLHLINALNLIENTEQRTPRRIRSRKNYFDILNDVEFHQRYRLTKESVLELLNLVKEKLEPNTYLNNALTPLEQILIALRFYASGTFQINVGDLSDVSQATTSRVITRVSEVIASLSQEFIKMPTTEEECEKLHNDFFRIGGFPGVIGALDCSHIPIKSPGGEDAERFRNRKGFFSINVQTIISADLSIQHVVARWPGSAHDSTIFSNSSVPALFEDTPALANYHLLGDSGYACLMNLLTPILNPTSDPERRYNTAHILTRNTVERKYGVIKRRFPCLMIPLRCDLKNIPTVIVACCVLHNLAVKLGDPEPQEDENMLRELSAAVKRIASDSRLRTSNQNDSTGGYVRRRMIIDEFFS